MNIAIVSCTQQKDYSKTLLHKSLEVINKCSTTPVTTVQIYTDNKEGLSKRYNQALSTIDADIMAFVHDDVWLDDGLLVHKLIEGHKKYDIIGVAGGVEPQIKAPALWHIMCGGFGPKLRGQAGHYVTETQSMVTPFGPTPDRVAIIDGVFMSVNTAKVKSANWMFNENYTFHHYDIASCLDANKLRLKIGVVPINVIHLSPGLRSLEDTKFQESQRKFLSEYESY